MNLKRLFVITFLSILNIGSYNVLAADKLENKMSVATNLKNNDVNNMPKIIDQRLAEFDYKMFCQGCHLPEAQGFNDIPKMNNYIGYFLQVEGGEKFILSVPGVTNAPISDAKLTNLMNWILYRFGGNSIPKDNYLFDERKVHIYRQSPEADPLGKRKHFVKLINNKFGM